MIWPAFLIGLLGSLHCLGMCGPIALALPVRKERRWSYILGRVLYNFGRIFTYSLLGGLVGLLGLGARVFEMQQAFSILAGSFLLLWALGELGWKFLPKPRLLDNLYQKLRSALGRQFGKGDASSLFTIGLLNGLLPCGFVYTGLFFAAIADGPFEGAGAMALFGLGTFPVMFLLSFSAKWATARLRSVLNRAMPLFMLAFGLLFILRGLSLGIPYVSPSLETGADGQVEVLCGTQH